MGDPVIDDATIAEPFEHDVALVDDPENEPSASDNPLDSLKPYAPRVTEDVAPFIIRGPAPRC